MDFILTDPARFLRERKKAKDRCEGLLREMQTPKAFVFERKLFTHLAEFQIANIIFQVVSRFFEDQIRDSFYRAVSSTPYSLQNAAFFLFPIQNNESRYPLWHRD